MDISVEFTRFVFAAQRWRAGLTRKEITIPGGLRYVYLEGGRGEPLLMLHGFGANKDNFTAMARYLTPHYRVIIPDHIGFGESSHPQDLDYAPPAQAARLRVLMHALAIRRFHLAGHSMGGQISLIYISLYAGDVKSLWLIDPGGVLSAPRASAKGSLLRADATR